MIGRIVETLDGARYFTLDRTMRRSGASSGDASELAIGLGCELKYAGTLEGSTSLPHW